MLMMVKRNMTREMSKIRISPTFLIILIGLLIVSSYVYFQSYNLIKGPIITTTFPTNGSVVGNSLVDIKGKAKNISYISLNDRQIFTNKEGVFNEKLLLSYGYNLITISAKDRFGRNTREILEIIYQ